MKIGTIVAMGAAMLALCGSLAFAHTTEPSARAAGEMLETAGCTTSTTGAIECSQGIGAGGTAIPCIKFNSTNGTSDTNAQICSPCTSATNCDIEISQEISGVMTTVARFDADSNADSTIKPLFTASFDGLGASQAATRMALGGGAFGPAVMGFGGTVGNVRCVVGEYSTTGTGGPSGETCTATTDCIVVEVFRNNADPSGSDCEFDDNDTTCTVAAGVTFSAMDRIELRISSGAGLSGSGNTDVVCSVYGRHVP